MLIKNTTINSRQTQKLGEDFAKNIIKQPLGKTAVVLGLSGNLGGGKTTFLQGFAKGLGVKEKILSPTFVIQKKFQIPNSKFTNFYHIDYYRLKNEKDILELGLKEIMENPENIVAIEWPEKIYPSGRKKNVLPKNIIKISLKFINENKREITIT
jgi:tRNA threonylcarbamoyladenosine biosynthesis protein TsaE